MTKEAMNNGHPERNIYERFAYLYKSVGYPNSSDMNKLSAIAPIKNENRRNKK